MVAMQTICLLYLVALSSAARLWPKATEGAHRKLGDAAIELLQLRECVNPTGCTLQRCTLSLSCT